MRAGSSNRRGSSQWSPHETLGSFRGEPHGSHALLLETVSRRANDGPCEFALLIPDVTDRKAADWTLETALRLMQQATRRSVEGLVGGPDPFESVQDAVRQGNFDEIIISTLPRRVSKWMRRDLIRRIEGLGLPVTAIVPGDKLSREEEAMMGGGGSGGLTGGGIL